MEGSSENIAEYANETQASAGGNIVLFILFVPTLLIVYIIPFLATIYAKNNAKKWIGYWIFVLALNYIIKPILSYIFGDQASSFLFLVLAATVLYISNNEKVRN